MTNRKPDAEFDNYYRIVAALDKPKTTQQLIDELGIIKGSIHAMLLRLLKYGAIERVGKRVMNDQQHGYLYARIMDSVRGEDVLLVNRSEKGRGKPVLKPTIPGARVVDFSRRDLCNKLIETQHMTMRERKARGATISGASFSMFDTF